MSPVVKLVFPVDIIKILTLCLAVISFMFYLRNVCVVEIWLKVDVRQAQRLTTFKVSIKYCFHCWKDGHIWNNLMYYFRYDLIY